MKKAIVLATIFALLGGVSAYGAMKVQQIKSWDFIASVETNTGNVFLYKIEDKVASTTCYVMTNDYTINTRINGANFGISCVK